MGRTIAVGLDADPGKGRVDLILLPDEKIPPLRAGLSIWAPLDLTRALYLLRDVFADHKEICSLGGAHVVGTRNPEWTAAIEKRLCEFLEDLGNCPLDSWAGAFNTLRNGAAIASQSNSLGLIDVLKGHPAICLGAGPSATPATLAHIARLSKNHVIFAADSMLKACKLAGFTPHFVTMLERPTAMQQFVAGAGGGSILIAPPVVDPTCVAAFERACFWWQADPLYKWLSLEVPSISSGRSAGTLSVSAAITSGCSPIYLVGHDLAYAPGRVGHSPAAHELAVSCQKTDDAKPAHGYYPLTQFQVPGYSTAPVWTNGLWNLFRGDIEAMVASNPTVPVYSAGNFTGAAIAGVPVVDLPENGLGLPLIPPINLCKSTVPDPRARLPALIRDMSSLVMASQAALVALRDHACPLDQLATDLATTRLVSQENAWLWHYILRSITSALNLRMQMHEGRTRDPDGLQRDCLEILCRTLPPLCGRIAEDLGRPHNALT